MSRRRKVQPARRRTNKLLGTGGAMEPSFIGLLLIIGFGLIWFWNSLYIIKEWEPGVVLRLGRPLPGANGSGVRLGFWPIAGLYRVNPRLETPDLSPPAITYRGD